VNEAIELLAEQIFKYAHPDVRWNHLKYLQVITLEDKCIEFTKSLLSLRYPCPECSGLGKVPDAQPYTTHPCMCCGGTGQGGRILTVEEK
jgi:DnaJ-class molecular chaperone